jgi:ATPase subunit of ABC transporter with duplicated ATPase domains
VWLKRYLSERLEAEETTLVVVSHDRAFLDDVCTRIIHFRNDLTLAYYMGNYSTFEQVIQDKNAFNAGLEEKIQMREKHQRVGA